MYNTSDTSKIVEKEMIDDLHFPAGDVLENTTEQSLREVDIRHATRLGNRERYKVKIVFEDDECVKVVRTTIWGVSDKRIILKAGVVIPMRRIHRIRFF